MGRQLSVNVQLADDLFLWTNGPFSTANGPFGRVNGPKRVASDPTPSPSDPFCQPNVRIHTRLVNSSPLRLLKSLEESTESEQFSLLDEWTISPLEWPVWTCEWPV